MICLHHKQELLTKFSLQQRNCSDPFNINPNKQRTKLIRVLCSYEKLKNPPPNVIPSEKTQHYVRD